MCRVAFRNCLIDQICFIVLLCRPLNFFKPLIRVLSSMQYIVLCLTLMFD